MGGAPKKDGVENNGVLPDVDVKSRGAPATDCLNGGEVDTCFSKGSSTT
jgi:hypothetical protein